MVRPLVMLALWTAAGSVQAADAEPGIPQNSVWLTVQSDTTGVPLADVKIYARIGDGPRELCASTDRNGRVTVKLQAWYFQPIVIGITGPGFVPCSVTWPSIERVPSRLTLKLAPAVPIGGIVRNEAGKAIAGATIKLRSYGSGSSGQFDLDAYPVQTDAEGRWRFDQAPDDPLLLSVSISHPDYADDWRFTYHDVAMAKALREHAWPAVLAKGLPVHGIVLDHQGQPIQGAHVGLGGLDPELYSIVATNEQGRFQTKRVATGESVKLVVAASGCSPELIEVPVEQGMAPVEFRLEPGHTVRGRVVDENGTPVPGAVLDVHNWRGCFAALHCRLRTDAAGGFEWKAAPPDPILVSVNRWGYGWLHEAELSPSAQPVTLALDSMHRVQGRVTDAETGRPIPEFTVLARYVGDDGEASAWDRRKPAYGAVGRYEVWIDPRWPRFALRVEADGYRPAVVEVAGNGDRDRLVNLTLERGEPVAARVLTRAGRAVHGALVVAHAADGSIRVEDGVLTRGDGAFRICRTDERGTFTLPPEPDRYRVLVLDAAGFAHFRPGLLDWGPIELHEWGRVEGNVRVGEKPAAEATLKLWYSGQEDSSSRVDYRYETKADETGRFCFDRVKPGRLGIGRVATALDGNEINAICVGAQVISGRTTTVQIGGTGYPVVGRLRCSARGDGEIDWRYSRGTLARVYGEEAEKRGVPATQPANGSEAPYHLAFCAERDGMFRVDDVLPGAYDLTIEVYASAEHEGGRRGAPIGSLTRQLLVPLRAEAEDGPPFDVGTLDVELRSLPEVGQAVPAFECETVDGGKTRLADFKGKVVLIIFWATWCGPCKAEFPHHKELHKQFADDGRFEIIGLSMDDDRSAPADYAKRNGLTWVQGFLDSTTKPELLNAYGVTGIPATFLIDPAGRLIAQSLHGRALEEAVAKALRDLPAEAQHTP